MQQLQRKALKKVKRKSVIALVSPRYNRIIIDTLAPNDLLNVHSKKVWSRVG